MQILDPYIIEQLIDKRYLPKNVDSYSYYLQGIFQIYSTLVARYLPAVSMKNEEIDQIMKDDKYYEDKPEEFIQDVSKLLEKLPKYIKKQLQKRLEKQIEIYNKLLIENYLQAKTKEEITSFQQNIKEYIKELEENKNLINKKYEETMSKYQTSILLKQLAQGNIPQDEDFKTKDQEKKTQDSKINNSLEQLKQQVEKIEKKINKQNQAKSTNNKKINTTNNTPSKPKTTDTDLDQMPVNLTDL